MNAPGTPALRVLVAEDSPSALTILRSLVAAWGYDVVAAGDGNEAWSALEAHPGPDVGILDWDMPGLTGTEICRRLRARVGRPQPYIILLTGKDTKDDVVSGFAAGADDYLIKPFNHAELRARLRAGQRIVELQAGLAARVRELEAALAQVRQLSGMLPICAYCKKIRDDGEYWQDVEAYVAQFGDVQFSHGICPDCFAKHVQPQLDELGS